MKRAYYYIPDRDLSRLHEAADGNGQGLSEFVRQAVVEKIDRNEVGRQMAEASGQLAGLLHEWRSEVGRIRQNLMTDQARSLDLMHQQIDKSLKRNEEMTKSFVMTLTRVLTDGGGAGPVPHGDHLPMQVPG